MWLEQHEGEQRMTEFSFFGKKNKHPCDQFQLQQDQTSNHQDHKKRK